MKVTGEARSNKECQCQYRQKENAGHEQRVSRTFLEFVDGSGG